MGDPELEADLVEVEAIRTLGPEAALERGLTAEAAALQAGPDSAGESERALPGEPSLTAARAQTAEPAPNVEPTAEPAPTSEPRAGSQSTHGSAHSTEQTAAPTPSAETPANVHPNRSLWLRIRKPAQPTKPPSARWRSNKR